MLLDPNGPLSALHKRVEVTGCQVQPGWSPLKALLVPFTEQQVTELMDLGYDLESVHVLALRADETVIVQALSFGSSCGFESSDTRRAGPTTNSRTIRCGLDRPKLKVEGLPEEDSVEENSDNEDPMLIVDQARGTERVLPGMLPGVRQLYFFFIEKQA